MAIPVTSVTLSLDAAIYPMAMPRLTSVFLLEEDLSRQHWSSNHKRYRIDRLYTYAEAVADPEDIPVDSLMYGWEHTNLDEKRWSDEFVARCQEADLSYPILVVQDDKGKLWPADGNHRIGKAIMHASEFILGYIVQERDLPEKAIEPKADGEESAGSRGRKRSSREP